MPSLALQDDQLHCGAQLCWANARFFTVAIKRTGKGKDCFKATLRSSEEMSQSCYLKPPARNWYPRVIRSRLLLTALHLPGLGNSGGQWRPSGTLHRCALPGGSQDWKVGPHYHEVVGSSGGWGGVGVGRSDEAWSSW